MTARTSRVIFQPSLNIYFGDRPYPTGIALMDVGSMYDRLTPTDATYMYGIGLSPQPCVMDITSGMATAAVAVLDVTSDMRSGTASITNTVINPPFISSFDIHSPSASAAPDLLMSVPAASPPANIYISPQMILP